MDMKRALPGLLVWLLVLAVVLWVIGPQPWVFVLALVLGAALYLIGEWARRRRRPVAR